MKINYIIATYNGYCKRTHKMPLPKDVLKCHLEKIIKLSTLISQITIMKATATNFYTDYYNIEEIMSITKIPIKIINCENFGYSVGQWLKSYEIFKDQFDYYLFMEDDYCPNMINYENIFITTFKNKFHDNIGLLCSLVQGNTNYKYTNNFPIHWEGSVFTNKETLKKLYEFPRWNGNPRNYLDKIDNTIDNNFNWIKQKKQYAGSYYQLTFSHLFTLSNIKHDDYLDIKYNNKLLQFPYWDDRDVNSNGGNIWFFEKNDNIKKNYILEDISNSPIIPIQLYNTDSIKYNANVIIY